MKNKKAPRKQSPVLTRGEGRSLSHQLEWRTHAPWVIQEGRLGSGRVIFFREKCSRMASQINKSETGRDQTLSKKPNCTSEQNTKIIGTQKRSEPSKLTDMACCPVKGYQALKEPGRHDPQ